MCVTAALVWFGSHRREWKASVSLSIYLAQKLQFISLFLYLIFCHEPEQKHRDTAGIRSTMILLLLSTFAFVWYFPKYCHWIEMTFRHTVFHHVNFLNFETLFSSVK